MSQTPEAETEHEQAAANDGMSPSLVTPSVFTRSPSTSTERELEVPALIEQWRGSLGLGLTRASPQDNGMPDHFVSHANALSLALSAAGVSDELRNSIEAVFRTAIELSTSSAGALSESNFSNGSIGAMQAQSPRSMEACRTSDTTSNSEADAGPTDHEPHIQAMLGVVATDKGSVDSTSHAHSHYDTSAEGLLSSTSFELYDRFGGWDLFTGAVGEMYARLSMDPRTAPFFENRPRHRLMLHMTGFLSSAMLGRCTFQADTMLSAHRCMVEHEGLGPAHVDIMCQHMVEVLEGMGASEEMITTAERVLLSQKYLFERSPEMPVELELGQDVERDSSSTVTDSSTAAAAARCPFGMHGS